MDNNHSDDKPRATGAKNRLWRLLRLRVRKHARRSKQLNAVDKQGVAFLLTLAVGVIGVTAAWGTGQLRRDAGHVDSDFQNSPAVTQQQEEELAETFVDGADKPEPAPTQQQEQIVDAAAALEQTLAGFRDPVDGEIICGFSIDELIYNDTLGEWRTHNGVDYGAKEGADVTAALAGTVVQVKKDALLGNVVTMEHENGVKSVYAGLDQIDEAVVEGASIDCGGRIGTVGTSASFEAHLGPHLHFELMTPQGYVDPHA